MVLVETGPPAYIPLLGDGLASLGLRPGDVTDVLMTHAHWDHVSNFMMFPNATKWIGSSELRWAKDLPATTCFVSTLHIKELLRRPDVERVKDGQSILPEIVAVATPGHTPGHMAYLATVDHGHLIFAGDAVKNLHELATLHVDSTLDAQASRRSVDSLRTLMREFDAGLVPGHDVLLRRDGGSVARTRAQRAQISFFASADEKEEDRSISDHSIVSDVLSPGNHPST